MPAQFLMQGRAPLHTGRVSAGPGAQEHSDNSAAGTRGPLIGLPAGAAAPGQAAAHSCACFSGDLSLELQPTARRPERQRSCRGSVGKSGRKAAPCGEWQESRPASRSSVCGSSAAPGPARPAGAARDFRVAAAALANSQIFHSRDILHFLI